MTDFDPYLRGYLAGRSAALKHGPVDKATLEKLRVIAKDIRRTVDRPSEPVQ